MRRFSSALTRSADRGRPAGIPSRTATRPRPCDSPAVVKRNVTLHHLHPPPSSTNLHQPPDNSTRARLRVGLVISPFVPLSTSWRGGQGVRPHGRGGACGLVFVMVGSETTTSPRVVMPNRYCWPLVASNATRSGPMIGSRIEIFRCWLKKNVSNTRMRVSGDALNTMRSAMFPEPPPQLTAQLGPGSKLWLEFMSIPGVDDPTEVAPIRRYSNTR